jgi:predicted phosphodiesterase
MKIVIISDTHGDHARLGRLSGDVLIHCGDFAVGHDNQEAALRDLDRWFAEQSFERVICVGGNHDFLVEERMAKGLDVFRHAECLQDQTLEIGGLKCICDSNSRGKSCGCEWLHQRVMAVRPRVHCFGHIHASAGVQRHADTVFVNGSVVNSRYEVCRGPVVLDIEPRRTWR